MLEYGGNSSSRGDSILKKIDPYHEWLGIPPKHQPPNHYRLLGLEQFEDDRNVIATAADRQMTFIKTYQTGPPEAEELSQRLLNELAAARICLLNREKKDTYDRSLRAELEKKQAAAAASQTQHLPGDDLSGRKPTSATTVPVVPTTGPFKKWPVPTLPTRENSPRPQQATGSPTHPTDAALASLQIAEPPLPRRPRVGRDTTHKAERSMIVPIAIGAGIGCIILAGALIAWFAMRSKPSSPAEPQLPIVADATVTIEEDHPDEPHQVEQPPAEPDPFELAPVEDPGESTGIAVPTERDRQDQATEPSDQPPDSESPDSEPPDAEPSDAEPSEIAAIPTEDSEPPSPPVEETLEQAEQRLRFEAAGVSTDSARERFVEEVLTVTDRAIVDSQAELARRLAELALKVARGSDSPELIQRVTLRLIEVRGPMTEALKHQARQRLDQP